MLFPPLNLVKGWAGDINVPIFHKLPLVAIEKRQNQGTNMGTVHIRIRHDHNTMIAQAGWGKLFTLDAQSQGSN